MSLADVTCDGPADLITPNPDHVAVLVAEEDGGFRPQATLPAPFGPFSIVAVDLNGDGRRDVAAASGEGAGSLATWHGLADGSFRAAGRYEIARGPTKRAAADLNGYGSAEVLVASYAAGEVDVLAGGDTPLLQRIEIVVSPYGLATGDYSRSRVPRRRTSTDEFALTSALDRRTLPLTPSARWPVRTTPAHRKEYQSAKRQWSDNRK